MRRRINGHHAGLIGTASRRIQNYLRAVTPCNSPGSVLFTMTIAPLLGLTCTDQIAAMIRTLGFDSPMEWLW